MAHILMNYYLNSIESPLCGATFLEGLCIIPNLRRRCSIEKSLGWHKCKEKTIF